MDTTANLLDSFAVHRFTAPLLVSLVGCGPPPTEDATMTSRPGTFADDVSFLEQHADAIVLGTGSSRVAVSASFQGRVMTSTAGGADGDSYGWIHRDAIAAGERQPHINAFGGEDRFWLGPEGGQFSIFFRGGDPFDLEHWQTPAPIDWGPWHVSEQTSTHATFTNEFELVNYSGTRFQLSVERTIRLLTEVPRRLGLGEIEATSIVGFESENVVTNVGDEAWSKDTGLLSVWILGMFKPSPETTIVVPIVAGPAEALGPVVNDTYFGKVPEDRLAVKDDVLLFRGDGEYRSKIGVSKSRARPIVGSYDARGKVLTLVHYTLIDEATDYVNSMWEIQDAPFAGDVVNSYNDGPPAPGSPPLGPFYELETSSAAAALAPGESLTHVHQTFHFQGPETELDRIAQRSLGVSLEAITTALSP